MGCGVCAATSREASITLRYDPSQQQFVPGVTNWTGRHDDSLLCPGREIDMPALAESTHGVQPADYVLGTYRQLRICAATDPAVRTRASSGGVVPAVLAHLFDSKSIDVAYALVSDGGLLEARGTILRSKSDLAGIHGSVYHPSDFSAGLRSLIEGQERFAFVGLPCQIAGLEELKRRRPDLKDRHVLSIGLFCGGVNRLGGVEYYLKNWGVSLDDIEHMDYRSGDWPGQIRLRMKDGSERRFPRVQGNTRLGILRYMAAFQGYWMLKRCRICPDQISDFADIAVGDPHVPEYRRQRGPGSSILITRSPRGENFVRALIAAGRLSAEPCSRDLIVRSQGYTLDNRRHALAYARVAAWLREPSPRIVFYRQVARNVLFGHYKYAFVDLLKIRLQPATWLRPFYVILQGFEYLFVTWYPSLFMRRLKRLLFNEGT
jgi:coenzyme F420 hydrogenase subunit beta